MVLFFWGGGVGVGVITLDLEPAYTSQFLIVGCNTYVLHLHACTHAHTHTRTHTHTHAGDLFWENHSCMVASFSVLGLYVCVCI